MAALAVVAAGVVGGHAAPSGAAEPGAPTAGEAMPFEAIAPCRIADSRAPGSSGVLAPGVARTLQVAGSGPGFAAQGGTAGGCGIPQTAVAVELTITVPYPSSSGFLRAWAAAAPPSSATFLNFVRGRSAGNTGTVPIATTASTADLAVRVFSDLGRHVVVDVQGYFAPGASLGYTSLTPCRIADTRAPTSPGPLGYEGPGHERTFSVAGTGGSFAAQGGRPGGCGVPDDAVAVEISMTATSTDIEVGFLRAWPADGEMSLASFLTFTHASVTNTGTLAIARDPSTRDLRLRLFGTSTDVVMDVHGYWSADGPLLYTSLDPCRVADTRRPNAGGPIGDGEGRLLQVAGAGPLFAVQGGTAGGCGVADDATAVEVTLTAPTPRATGWLRASAQDPSRSATVLNVGAGVPITNTAALAIRSSASTDDITVRAFDVETSLIVDVQGYFSPRAPS